ncbi:MAG: twitching motility protein PilT [Verrucomicrobiota bacterium]
MRGSHSLRLIRTIFVVICCVIGLFVGLAQDTTQPWLGVVVGLAFGSFILLIDLSLRDFSIRGFSTGTFGLLIGLLCAWLITRIDFFGGMFEFATHIFHLMAFIGLGFIGMMLALRSKREEFSLLIPYVRFRQDSLQEIPLLLDSNVIIDGRIMPLCDTGFVGGAMIVPRFVLDELQLLADSPDDVKRQSGKRGLDNLKEMQEHTDFDISIYEDDVADEKTVDGKLVGLGTLLGARVLTNDSNLSKIARLKGVSVLNLNELSQAVKPKILPGEKINLELVKEGKDEHQAVGYLADGTMIVVNQGRHYVGSTRSVEITKSVQTSGGRLIFAELVG